MAFFLLILPLDLVIMGWEFWTEAMDGLKSLKGIGVVDDYEETVSKLVELGKYAGELWEELKEAIVRMGKGIKGGKNVGNTISGGNELDWLEDKWEYGNIDHKMLCVL